MKFWITVVVGTILVTALSTAMFVLNPSMRRADRPEIETEEEEAPTELSGGIPRIVADVREVTVSDVPQMEKGDSHFTVKNTGDGPLELTPGKPSCTCAGVKLEKKVLAPGEEGVFTLQWESRSRVGKFVVSAPLYTNDPDNKKITFLVKLFVQKDIIIRDDPINFGSVFPTDTPRESLYILSSVTDDLQLHNLKCTNKSIEFTPRKLEQAELDRIVRDIGAKSGYEIELRLIPPLPIGFMQELFTFETNIENDKERSVFIKATVEGPGNIVMTPKVVDFGVIDQEEPHVVRIEIFRKNAMDDDILSLGHVSPKFVKVELTQDKDFKSRWLLEATVPAGSPAGPFQGSIAIMDQNQTKVANIVDGGIIYE